MDRRGTSVLLLPLLAAFALFYPAATQRTTSESVETFSAPTKNQQTSGKPQPGSSEDQWSGGRNLVHDFLGLLENGKPSWGPKDSRRKTQIEFLIATLPDPIDSGLPDMFDRLLGSIQDAAQWNEYLLSSFDLPWQGCLIGNKPSTAEEQKGGQHAEDKQKDCPSEPWDTQPGVLLLTKLGDGTKGELGKLDDRTEGEIHLLLLYVVGETPASGIHKEALHAALDEMASFCGWGKHIPGDIALGLPSQHCMKEIRLLGPTFSGSAQSLDFALSSWMNRTGKLHEVSLRMVSGSATAINPSQDFANLLSLDKNQQEDSRNRQISPQDQQEISFSFYSMQVPDDVASCGLLRYLEQAEPHHKRRKVALLSESNTAYGQVDTSSRCWPRTEVTTIKFPLHVSQLRAALEKARQSEAQATPQLLNAPEGLSLRQALEEVNQPQDTDAVPPLSQLDPATAEQVMAQLLSTISREGFRYVGIMATDVRDIMFLAKEVREHCPTTVLFAFGSDLLFLHPEENPNLRGMLLATSYPLANSNQLWSPPYHSNRRFQFADPSAEGVYNATQALLGDDKHSNDDKLLEYGLPFDGAALSPSGQTRPPLWITVVGRDRLWPLRIYNVNGFRSVQTYMYGVSSKRAGSLNQDALWRGLLPHGSAILMTIFGIFCFVLGVPLSARLWRPAVAPQPSLIGQSDTSHAGESWFMRFFGECVSEAHRRHGELYLLAACASLFTFSAVALIAVLVPVKTLWQYVQVSPFLSGLPWTVKVAAGGLCIGVVSLISSSLSLLTALKSRRAKGFSETPGKLLLRAWVPILAVFLVLFVIALNLGRSWMSRASAENGYSSFFTSLRSLDLLSGVSALVPLFLICMAGVLWALNSFRRIRQLEAFDTGIGFLCFRGRPLREITRLEKKLRLHLKCPSLQLPGWPAMLILATSSGLYVCDVFVRSLESRSYYLLLAVIFWFVNLLLWYGVLRFYHVWKDTHHLLRRLQSAPLRAACKRFRATFPQNHKIDLASPPPTLARLVCSVEQARILHQSAQKLVEPASASLKAAAGAEGWPTAEVRGPSQETRLAAAVVKAWPPIASGEAGGLSPRDESALLRLGSEEMARRLREAEKELNDAQEADAGDDWRQATIHKWCSQDALSDVATEVASALQDVLWRGMPVQPGKGADTPPSQLEAVLHLGEEYIVGRVAHFLAYVLPQMQNLMVTSIGGLLLILFAISSYPFQPHNLLLLFSWTVILAFVGIAMWVFVQMNRDPVLSCLNGTTPGKINWDFAFRIFTYGIVPILALLGAQFPQSVGQIVSHFIPGEAMHH